MAVDERMRHEMYSGPEEKLGTKVANAVMAHLPPVGWADVATKQDLEFLRTSIGQRFDQADTRFDRVEGRVDDMHRLMLWLFSTQIAVIGLMIGIAKVT